jgi:hypothetical protein
MMQKGRRHMAQVLVRGLEDDTGDLSCERESSEQFVWLNRRYGKR